MESNEQAHDHEEPIVSRRAIMKAGAWAAPAIVLAAAVPAASASVGSGENLGAIRVNGACGVAGVVNDGFDIRAGSGGIPVGTTVSIVLTGGNAITWAGGGVDNIVFHPDGQSATYTFTAPLAAGATKQLRVLAVLVSRDSVVTATLVLPAGYAAGAGSKLVGTVTLRISGIIGDSAYCTAA